MKIELHLLRHKKETPEGFPLAVELSHKGKRKQRVICQCKNEHFIEAFKMIGPKHPMYDLLAPVIMELKQRAKKIIISQETDVEKAFLDLFEKEVDGIGFLEFSENLIFEMKELAGKFDFKKDLTSRNRLMGNVKVYENFINQVRPFVQGVALEKIDHELLHRFRAYQVGIGNSKNTVHQYLRTFRAIYNKGILKYGFVDKKPFSAVFSGLKLKSYQNKKKYLLLESIGALENFSSKTKDQNYIYLFLLQYYFGGCDLIDLYFMKKSSLRNGRIYFERGKHGTGLLIDLKIHPKAVAILKNFENDTEWLIDWRKDVKGYETFRSRYARVLIKVQTELGISVMPTGGNLSGKVARHSFATRAKNLNLEPDLIRELMGHERDDVDQYYKDKFPEAVRDEALFRIICWYSCCK